VDTAEYDGKLSPILLSRMTALFATYNFGDNFGEIVKRRVPGRGADGHLPVIKGNVYCSRARQNASCRDPLDSRAFDSGLNQSPCMSAS